MEILIDILSNKPLNGDLDFILTTDDTILYENGNLAIPSQLVGKLYKESWNLFISDKRAESKTLSTMVLSLFNPECYTIWNERRLLLQQEILNPNREHELTSFLLTKYPSKSRIWDYRCWIVKNYQIPMLSRRDEHICNMAAERYKCNYPSWNFRRSQVLTRLRGRPAFLLELDGNKVFVKSNLSDSSGLSYRQSVMLQLQPSKEEIQVEFEWTKELILFYPNHESIWLYLRFLAKLDSSIAMKCLVFAESLLSVKDQARNSTLFLFYLAKFNKLNIGKIVDPSLPLKS